MTSEEHSTSTFRALALVSLTFFVAITAVVYLILGMMSLLMALFPWSP
jgi:hypothetical protein